MKKDLLSYLAALLIFILAIPAVAPAQEQTAEQTEEAKQDKPKRTVMDLLRQQIIGGLSAAIEILSRGSMETTGDWVTIRDDAQVSYRGTTVMADQISFNQSTYELQAEGNVVLLTEGTRIGGDSLSFNLRERTGNVSNALIETGEGFILAGETLQKYGPDRYRIEHARITSCTQPTPHWLLRAALIDFQVKKAASLRHARFNIGKMPLFYTPWIRLPMNTERSSGLLMPTWGTSDFHGFFFNTTYFWAINRSHDATFGFDHYEKRGFRYNAEYRNDLGNNNFTSTFINYIDDDLAGYGRYEARFRARQSLPLGFTTTGDLQYISDREYRRDFINRNIYYSPIFRRTGSIYNSFDVYSYSVGFKDTNRFVGDNRVTAIRYLPTVDFNAREKRIFNLPVYYSFKSNYSHIATVTLQRPSESESFEETYRKSYHRLDLLGTLKAPLTKFSPWLTLTPTFEVRHTDYSKRYSPKKDRIVDKRYARRYYDAGFELTGPVFSRIFGSPEQNATRHKHIIEPRLTYKWRSDIEKEDRIIVVDSVDNFYKVHELQWSLSNRILRKTPPRRPGQTASVVELVKVGLSQYVSLEDTLLTSYYKSYTYDDQTTSLGSRYSPLRIDTMVRLGRNLYTTTRMDYSISEHKFVTYTLRANVDFRNILYTFGWYKTAKQYSESTGYYTSASNRLITGGSADLFDGMLTVRGSFDYNFLSHKILNYLVGGSINGQCLGLSFEVRKLNILGQQDTQAVFGLTIGGLRSILSPQPDF